MPSTLQYSSDNRGTIIPARYLLQRPAVLSSGNAMSLICASFDSPPRRIREEKSLSRFFFFFLVMGLEIFKNFGTDCGFRVGRDV